MRILFFLLLASPFFAASSVIQVLNNAANREILRMLDLDSDCMGRSHQWLDVFIDDSARQRLEKSPTSRNRLLAGSRVKIADVESRYKILKQKDLGLYHSYAEMESELQSLAATNSDFLRLKVAGTSREGKKVYAVELSDFTSAKAKKNFLIMGSHHSREWISVEVPLAYIQHMLQSRQDAQVKQFLATSLVVIVPMVNPDGSVYSREQYTYWRKNRTPNANGSFGVDNNRNYAFQWGTGGSSNSPDSDTFMGSGPGSEIENQIVLGLQKQYGFTVSVSFHSYSELILWPWGYTDQMQSKDHAVFARYAEGMAKILGYKPEQISDLYVASGGYDDQYYHDFGVLSYTIELGTWFIPDEHEIAGICEQNIKALKYLFTEAREPFASVVQSAEYKAAAAIENLVEALVSKKDPKESLLALKQFKAEEIQGGMTHLKMKSGMRQKIQGLLKETAF